MDDWIKIDPIFVLLNHSFLICWIVGFLSATYGLYRYGTSTFTYFSDQGIPGPKPIPFIGNAWGIWKQNLPKHDMALVKKYGKVFGYFDGLVPNLWITDPQLIKSIFVTNFDHFRNLRDFKYTTKVGRKFLTFARDEEWEDIRASIAPAFTIGKILRYGGWVKKISEKLAEKLHVIAKREGKFDAQDSFTMEIIGRCAFGMEIEKLTEKTEDPLFIQKARKVFDTGTDSPLLLLAMVFPKLLSYFSNYIFKMTNLQYFTDLMENIIKKRARTNQKFYDFPEIASESIKEYTKVVDGRIVPMWTSEEVDEIVAAQSTLFLLSGYRTTTSAFSSSVFCLARNQEIQEKLYQQIKNKLDQHGILCKELVDELPYIEQFIFEVLRMYPPGIRVERECNEDITYDGIYLKKGTVVTVPITAVHYSEEYYPDPYKFNPDRWDAKNKKNMNPYAFMTFGLGPRNCIGEKVILEQMKIVLCILLLNFRFFPVEKTPEKIEFKDGFIFIVQGMNIVIGVSPRNSR